MTRAFRHAGVGAVCVLAGACAGSPANVPVPVEDRDDSSPAEPAPVTVPQAAPAAASGRERVETLPVAPAVVALLAESDRRLGSGQPESAAATIERALRIAPADPLLWYRLARIRYSQGRWSDAEALARKSISLAAGKDELLSANWILIAAAREGLGDMRGAREAKEQASDLRPQR